MQKDNKDEMARTPHTPRRKRRVCTAEMFRELRRKVPSLDEVRNSRGEEISKLYCVRCRGWRPMKPGTAEVVPSKAHCACVLRARCHRCDLPLFQIVSDREGIEEIVRRHGKRRRPQTFPKKAKKSKSARKKQRKGAARTPKPKSKSKPKKKKRGH